jgi:hypothetical protein
LGLDPYLTCFCYIHVVSRQARSAYNKLKVTKKWDAILSCSECCFTLFHMMDCTTTMVRPSATSIAYKNKLWHKFFYRHLCSCWVGHLLQSGRWNFVWKWPLK